MSNICLVQQTFVMKNDVQTVILYLTYLHIYFHFAGLFKKRRTSGRMDTIANQISLVL